MVKYYWYRAANVCYYYSPLCRVIIHGTVNFKCIGRTLYHPQIDENWWCSLFKQNIKLLLICSYTSSITLSVSGRTWHIIIYWVLTDVSLNDLKFSRILRKTRNRKIDRLLIVINYLWYSFIIGVLNGKNFLNIQNKFYGYNIDTIQYFVLSDLLKSWLT